MELAAIKMIWFPFKKRVIFLFTFLFILISFQIYPQVETVAADHSVYSFLKKMKLKGVLDDYNDIIIPKSSKKILKALKIVEKNKDKLSDVEKKYVKRLIVKLDFNKNYSPINVFDNFPSEFPRNVISGKEKHIYFYRDSIINFTIDPLVKLKTIYRDRENKTSTLFEFGGIAKGSYKNWLGFYLEGTNGIQFGDRQVARIDRDVEQSFTFNKTGINNFDGTKGYLRFEKGIINAQFGRERILWGTGYLNKLFLGNNPPLFDFLRINLSYKSLSYNFLHGWLTQPAFYESINNNEEVFKTKNSKYFAISRFEFNPSNLFSIGLSQVIVYANRPFEAAYLNPFLFWESAQRSLNDLDNSYLSIDSRSKITDGLEISGSFVIDDIDFDLILDGIWNKSRSSFSYQLGSMLTEPLLPANTSFMFEYTMVRPYMYSHPGAGESLTYTNNGYLLASDILPNSFRFSSSFDYRISDRLLLTMSYSHTEHGKNIYDEEGNLIKNVGGDFKQYLTLEDSEFAYLLDGVLEKSDIYSFNIQYEFLYGYYLNLNYQLHKKILPNYNNTTGIFIGSFQINLN